MTALADVLSDIETKANEVKLVFDEADEKNNGEVTDDGRAKVVKLNKEIEDLEKKALDLKGDDAIREANERRRASFSQPAHRPVLPGADGKGNDRRVVDIKTLGQLFVENPEWVAYFKTIAPTGVVGDKQRVSSPSLLLPYGVKTLVTGASVTSGGALIIPDQSGIFETLGRKPLALRDIISVRTTSSDLVEYVRQTSRVNAAAPVAEATATAGSSGVKPEGGFAFERIQAPVKTIAEWVPATKRALSDAGQMRGIIDDELRADLNEELNDQIVNGSGVGENFEGIDAVSGTQDQAWATDLFTTTRKARTLVRLNGRATPNAYLFNPLDWETIDLLQDNEARYFFGGPSELGTPRLWGLPVVEDEAQTQGWGWVGDFKKVVLWDREQATMSVSDAHADFFIRNLVAILGELRAALGITRPSALVEMDLTA